MKYIFILFLFLFPILVFSQTEQDIEVQVAQLNSAYRLRLDIIENLIAALKGSGEFDGKSLAELSTARSKAAGSLFTPQSASDSVGFMKFEKIQDNITLALSHVFKILEKKSQVISQQNISTLLAQLEGQENRIRVECQRYNDFVAEMSDNSQYQFFKLKPMKAEMLTFETNKIDSIKDEFIEVSEEPKSLENIQTLVVYPPKAKKAGIQGSVTFSALIGIDGKAEKVTIDKSDNIIFNQTVIDAVKNTKFKPAIGAPNTPVRVWYTETLVFKLKPDEVVPDPNSH